ncbi:MAG: endonuclease III [Cytophagaceae bacterium]|nr:endonuclease III [Cytophagaceae bacterium]MDW8455896.1 endonuclease III [Cytophagaceae bacterium]
MTRKERYERFIAYFTQHMPEAKTELIYNNPYELLVAVILSAQCTDKRVNMVTPELFKKYPTVYDLAKATPEEVFALIKTISYPNNKSKHLVSMARMLVEDFSGEVPANTDELQKLPGVGRKTANVIASVIYNMPAMPVDTHVFRVSKRIGLATQAARTPLEVEKQLLKYIPERYVHLSHHWLILHGRYVCVARNPKCTQCGLKDFCHYFSRKARVL